jgi:hypothetical protein
MSGPWTAKSLLPLTRGARERTAFATSLRDHSITRGSPRLALIENRYKLPHEPGRGGDLLFDLQADPQERVNLASRLPVEAARMRRVVD